MHVLVATKYSDLRLSIELLLSEEPGVTIVGAASETEGLLALIQSARPDIVIMDWDLPGRPVDSLLRLGRVDYRPVRFILLGAQPDLREKALDAGADAFVVKGTPPDQLLDTFRQVIAQRKAVIEEPEGASFGASEREKE